MPAKSTKSVSRPVKPRRIDVLCGKSAANKHEGNLEFRKLIHKRTPEYMACVRKSEKGRVVLDILESLQSAGVHFLKQDSESKLWYHIEHAEAREKVSHAVRDRVRDIRKGGECTRRMKKSKKSNAKTQDKKAKKSRTSTTTANTTKRTKRKASDDDEDYSPAGCSSAPPAQKKRRTTRSRSPAVEVSDVAQDLVSVVITDDEASRSDTQSLSENSSCSSLEMHDSKPEKGSLSTPSSSLVETELCHFMDEANKLIKGDAVMKGVFDDDDVQDNFLGFDFKEAFDDVLDSTKKISSFTRAIDDDDSILDEYNEMSLMDLCARKEQERVLDLLDMVCAL